jgi:hypothetical protein
MLYLPGRLRNLVQEVTPVLYDLADDLFHSLKGRRGRKNPTQGQTTYFLPRNTLTTIVKAPAPAGNPVPLPQNLDCRHRGQVQARHIGVVCRYAPKAFVLAETLKHSYLHHFQREEIQLLMKVPYISLHIDVSSVRPYLSFLCPSLLSQDH